MYVNGYEQIFRRYNGQVLVNSTSTDPLLINVRSEQESTEVENNVFGMCM